MRGSGITIAAGLAWLGVGRNGSWSENNGLLDFIYSVILIIVYGLKKGFLALLLALAAKAKKINPVSVNLETGFFGNLLCQVFQTAQIGVDDFFAPRAYQVGVRVRFVAVITIASIRQLIPKLSDSVDAHRVLLGSAGRMGRRNLFAGCRNGSRAAQIVTESPGRQRPTTETVDAAGKGVLETPGALTKPGCFLRRPMRPADPSRTFRKNQN